MQGERMRLALEVREQIFVVCGQTDNWSVLLSLIPDVNWMNFIRVY